MGRTLDALRNRQADLRAKLAEAKLKTPEALLETELQQTTADLEAAEAEDLRQRLEAAQGKIDQLTGRAEAEARRCIQDLEAICERMQPILTEYHAYSALAGKYDAVSVHKARPFVTVLASIQQNATGIIRGANEWVLKHQ